MAKADVDYLPLSALNDLLFCERRCAMHRVEQIWTENAFTLEGTWAHRRADSAGEESSRGVRAAYAVLLKCDRLLLSGKADVVEFHATQGDDDGETPYPVEYKRGKRRRWDNDDVQLCAQALCLEEMFGRSVPAGAIFHIHSKRRREIAFTAALRAQTEEAARRLHELFASGETPPPVLKPRCQGCSLHDVCLPELLTHVGRVDTYCRNLYVIQPE